MITNKDIRVENGFLIINGDKYPLDGQSPEAIMQIVEDNSDSTPTAESTAPITSDGVYTALAGKEDTLTVEDISSQVTLDSTHVSEFKAYKYGKLLYIILSLKVGVTDQTTVVTGLPTIKGLSGVKGVLPMFFLNAADATSNGVCAISSGNIEYRGSTTTGSLGTVYSGMFILE